MEIHPMKIQDLRLIDSTKAAENATAVADEFLNQLSPLDEAVALQALIELAAKRTEGLLQLPLDQDTGEKEVKNLVQALEKGATRTASRLIHERY